MVVLNQHDAYAFADSDGGQPKTITDLASSESAKHLDRSTFRDFLKNLSDGCVYVVGKNTWADLGDDLRKRILARAASVVVSSNDEICIIDSDGTHALVEFSDESNYVRCGTLASETLIVARYHSIGMKPATIVVLGGHSVYKAFSGMYTTVYQCEIHTKEHTPQFIMPYPKEVFLRRWSRTEEEHDAIRAEADPDENNIGFTALDINDMLNASISRQCVAQITPESIGYRSANIVDTPLYSVTKYIKENN
jgi:hypothetical protein